jgi:hypothetical protein
MAKYFVEGTPKEVKAVLPPGSGVVVSDASFSRGGRPFSLALCSPGAESAPGRPSDSCAAHLRKVFTGRTVVAYVDFADDEVAGASLF